jgi:SAM-dependent methyltransferase
MFCRMTWVISHSDDIGTAFSADPANVRWFSARVVRAAAAVQPDRLLDIGCGDASFIAALADVIPGIALVGVDVTAANIAAARERIARSPHAARLSVAYADYMSLNEGRFPLVTAFGSLQAIGAPPSEIASKLRRDLAPGGMLISVMPKRSLYNRALNTIRRALVRLRGPFMDRSILVAAKLLHPGRSVSWLHQRVHCMYHLPRQDGETMRAALCREGFQVLDEGDAPHPSIGALQLSVTVLVAPAAR